MRRQLIIFLVLAMLSSVPLTAPAAAAGLSAAGSASSHDSNDAPFCQGDITSTSVEFSGSQLRLALSTACGSNPNTDDAWVIGLTAIEWRIVRPGWTGGDWYAGLYNDGERPVVEVIDDGGRPACGGSPEWDGNATFTIVIDADCRGLGNSVRVQASMSWDEAPHAESCTCPTDFAPDGDAGDVVYRSGFSGRGYWMVSRTGDVYNFGDAGWHGNRGGATAVVDLEPTPTSRGYWILDEHGNVTPHGDATGHGSVQNHPMGPLRAGERTTALSAAPAGNGYWVFTSLGRVYSFGATQSYGDMSGTRLNGPVLDAIATPTGHGYYMVGSDGGIFTFGDALFQGSMGATPLNAPVQSLVPDPDGLGYWLVASDGGIFSFEAPFFGSTGSMRLNKPITSMVGFGSGYLMVAEDGGIFTFGEAPFYGSLGDNPPPAPIVSAAILNNP